MTYTVQTSAGVAELADALDSGSSVHHGRGGSNPLTRTDFYGFSLIAAKALFLLPNPTWNKSGTGGHLYGTCIDGLSQVRNVTFLRL